MGRGTMLTHIDAMTCGGNLAHDTFLRTLGNIAQVNTLEILVASFEPTQRTLGDNNTVMFALACMMSIRCSWHVSR